MFTSPSAAYIPAPVNVTRCGLPAALSRIVIVADLATLRFGLNVTLIVQFVPGASPAPPIGQVLVCANRAGLAPPSVMLVMITGSVPELLTVIV